ncbi:MAG: transcription factor FapR [Bacillota bacterium]|jgi:acyl-coenzyme A thioesterase PaaI-like protein
MEGRFSRETRHERLREKINENPFMTDEELAQYCDVSVHTIRHDRALLGIPELRERIKDVATRSYGIVKSLGSKEIIGELVDVVLGESGISILKTTPEMVFEKTRVVRGHHIFSQADSLAMALVDADAVLTGIANIKFRRPVRVGERLVARAEVLRRKGNKYVVRVITRVGGEQVFRGKFVVFAVEPLGGEGPDENRG